MRIEDNDNIINKSSFTHLLVLVSCGGEGALTLANDHHI